MKSESEAKRLVQVGESLHEGVIEHQNVWDLTTRRMVKFLANDLAAIGMGESGWYAVCRLLEPPAEPKPEPDRTAERLVWPAGRRHMLNPQVNCSWCGTATRLEAQVCLGCRAVFTGDRQMGEPAEPATVDASSGRPTPREADRIDPADRPAMVIGAVAPDEDEERAMAVADAMRQDAAVRHSWPTKAWSALLPSVQSDWMAYGRSALRWLRENPAGKSVRLTSHFASGMTFPLMDELRMKDNRGTVRPGRLWFEPDEEGE